MTQFTLLLTRCGWRYIGSVDSKLTVLRKSRGLSLTDVAEVVGTDRTNLSRIERGQQLPNRTIARALYRLYDGAISLGEIYDPEFSEQLAP